MFESLMGSIDRTFGNVVPHEFCVPCFLAGLLKGLGIGLATLAIIAALPEEIAILATVGLAVLGVEGVRELASKWSSMSDNAKSEALGTITGGTIVAGLGPKLPPKPLAIPVPGLQWLATSEGTAFPALVTEEATVSATAGASTAAAAAGVESAAMMADDGGGGGDSPTSDEGGSKKRSTAGNMQKQVERDQAPRSVDRVDKARFPHEKDQVHFEDGSALNYDGTWKHGGRPLTNTEKEWLQENGWTVPK